MKFLKDYSLSIVLFFLFLFSWIGQGYFQYQEFSENQKAHKQVISITEFMPEFFSATFENWQSEFLQLFSMVILTAFLYHKGSHESKDNDEDVTRRLQKIERLLENKKAAKK